MQIKDLENAARDTVSHGRIDCSRSYAARVGYKRPACNPL